MFMPIHNDQTNIRGSDFTMRGQSMSRLETLVAAAFAFAVTMLIISVGNIPKDFAGFMQAVQLIPSSAASFAIIFWIWSTHANWCRRYGLEEGLPVVLSGMLVFIVLVYIFPLRLMMQGMFSYLSGGYLSSEMHYQHIDQARFMFAFFAIGFMLLAINFAALFYYALRKKNQLQLSTAEIFHTYTEIQQWSLTAAVASLSLLGVLFLPDAKLAWAGFTYFLLFPVLGLHGWLRHR
jgi:hypothetical protein